MDRKRSFSPRDLQVMDLAYHYALAELLVRYPDCDGQTKEALRRKIVLLASYNIKEPKTLGDLALDQIVLSRRDSHKMRPPRRLA
jgi:hypothetical protein